VRRPFVGTLLAALGGRRWCAPAFDAGLLHGLALPFFLLACPSYLKSCPAAADGSLRVKVVMGFVILAAMSSILRIDQVSKGLSLANRSSPHGSSCSPSRALPAGPSPDGGVKSESRSDWPPAAAWPSDLCHYAVPDVRR